MTDPALAGRWSLTLYVDGATTTSLRAIETVRLVCDERLADRVDLEVIDVHEQPDLVAGDQLVAVPTLVRRLPGPPRRIVGDLSRAAWLSIGVDLGPVEAGDARPDPAPDE